MLGQTDVVSSVTTSSGSGVHSAWRLQRKHYFKTENEQRKKIMSYQLLD